MSSLDGLCAGVQGAEWPSRGRGGGVRACATFALNLNFCFVTCCSAMQLLWSGHWSVVAERERAKCGQKNEISIGTPFEISGAA